MHDTLKDRIRAYLRDHPGASKRKIVGAVGGSPNDAFTAIQAMIDAGEIAYEAPEGRGKPGRCTLVEAEPNDVTADWKPAVRCPKCHRPPAIRFTEREVLRARRDRQSARIQNYRCNRCGTVYWIQAKHIAAATLDAELRAA